MDHEASQSLAHLQRATAKLFATVGHMSDAQASEPSLLPGWTRGHVLTHLARNAEGIGNLLRSARTGTEIPMYASREARDTDIEAGAGRPAADLLADLRTSAATLEAAAASLPDEAWAAIISTHRGQLPARAALHMRLSEVEVHHVDLGLGYQPQDWPATFAPLQLPRAAAALAGREDTPACLLQPEDADPVRIGPAAARPDGEVTVSGPAWALLAWLLSRADGTALTADPPGTLPAMPPWG